MTSFYDDIDDICAKHGDKSDYAFVKTAVRVEGGQRVVGGGGASSNTRGNASGTSGRGRGTQRGRTGGGARGRGGSRGKGREQQRMGQPVVDMADVDVFTGTTREGKAQLKAVSGTSKVGAMQHLHMSAENQKMVRGVLNGLTAQMAQEGDEDEQEGEDTEEECDDGYEWHGTTDVMAQTGDHMIDDQPESAVVGGVCEGAGVSDQEAEMKAVRKRAVEKLQRYGFDAKRCVHTLDMLDGDVGRALELLLSMAADTDGVQGSHHEPACAMDVMEQREEEMTALTAIYEDAFVERIANHVWSVHLDLPYLDTYFGSKTNTMRNEVDNFTTEVCKWYLQGHCKFGKRCKYRHITTTKPEIQQHDGSRIKYMYELEVRFPPGHTYPLTPPLVGFCTLNPLMPSYVCLNISTRLMRLAYEESNCGLPLVFTLVSFLEDNGELETLCHAPLHELSNPEPTFPSRTQVDNSQRTLSSPSSHRATSSHQSKEIPSAISAQLDEDLFKEDLNAAIDMSKQEEYRRKFVNRKGSSPPKNTREGSKMNGTLRAQFSRLQSSDSYLKMVAIRKKLPAWNKREELLKAIQSNQVVVVSGMTGCGKTTQVPQFILDAWLRGKDDGACSVVVTQPRRLSAIAVAQRVAQERTEKLGRTVGYQIRLESIMSAATRLMFCTTGILLRRLEGDAELRDVTHVLLDEVHERTAESDFLLLVLRDLLLVRPDLKVILMSATLDAHLFSSYFDGCTVINIPGRTFPVDQYFLEDAIEVTEYTLEDRSPYARPIRGLKAPKTGDQASRMGMSEMDQELKRLNTDLNEAPPRDSFADDKLTVKELFARYQSYSKATIKVLAALDHDKINNDLIEELLAYIVEGDHDMETEGAMLVFLPGMAEITTLYKQLQASSVFGGSNQHRYLLIPLHSMLSSEAQQQVFEKPPSGVRKIVIATNIAETSITIDDVVFVVDTGHMKEKRYEASKGMESLQDTWVSRANALQRKGRAGRVKHGVVFHLFTSHRFEHHLSEQPVPEILRIPLEQLILRIKILQLFQYDQTEEVFAKLIEPPAVVDISIGMRRLYDLGALDESKQLTPLGYHLSSLPVDVRIGKLMLYGAMFSCVDATLTIAAMLTIRSPFVAPLDKRDEADAKKLSFAVGNSDHLTMLRAYQGWQGAMARGQYAGYCFCQENFLSIKTMQTLASMKQQFAVLLSDYGFVRSGVTARAMERRGNSDGVRHATGDAANVNSDNMKLVAAVLVAALYPNVVQVVKPDARFQSVGGGAVAKTPKATDLKFTTKEDGFINIHPSSVNYEVGHYDSPFLVYHEKLKTTKVYVRDVTMVSVYPLLLFGGCSISVQNKQGSVVISLGDGWIRFVAQSHQVAQLIQELRLELHQLLQDKIEHPEFDLSTCPRASTIIPTIVKLITTQ